jgi:hypothetical protein
VKARFVHVGFRFTGPAPIEALKQTFDHALDWLRYSPNCWILYTSTEATTWRDRIRKVLRDADSFYLCEFDPKSATGYMHKFAWDWLKKHRPE